MKWRELVTNNLRLVRLFNNTRRSETSDFANKAGEAARDVQLKCDGVNQDVPKVVHVDVTATVSTDVGNVEVQRGQNCLQVICEAGPAIKQVVSRVDGVNTVSKLLIYTTVHSDFGDVTLANEEDLEQSGLEEESHEVTVDGQHQSQ